MSKATPKVTIIIPVFNCEDYLQECLDSVYGQTFQDYEIIAINDGSTDDSLEILERNAKNRANFKVISQENSGQGSARNMAVKMARGEYVQFVDSDDKIDALTLELTVARAERDKSDIVHYDWKWSSLLPHRPAAFLYLNKEPFSYKSVLEGAECDELLQLWHFFTVNNLYRKTFLIKQKVFYGEGRIYEDIIFMVLAANRAKKISILHSPLYIIRRNMISSSRSGYHDDRHSTGYVKAVENALRTLQPRTEYTTYYLMKYLQTKFIFYYVKRVPRNARARFLRAFVDAVSDVEIKIPDNGEPERIMRFCVANNVYSQRRYRLFELLIYYKTRALPQRDKSIEVAKKVKRLLTKRADPYAKALNKPIARRSVIFLGFDHRYTGNSRYLFEEVIADKRFKDRAIWFATNDEQVDGRYRLSPHSDEFYERLARAEVIVAESWLPGYIKKREDAILLQLWHGTALKKLLFDSNESEILQRNQKYKIGKHWNLTRWDYLLADSKEGMKKFRSAFLFPESRIVQAGYPRVKHLIDNKGNDDLKQSIKLKMGMNGELGEKKVVLYAPTWRDYNYRLKPEDQDLDYVLDVQRLADRLGEDYLVIYNNHHFLSTIPNANHPRCMDVSNYETQELLLISDYLVTDYSSIMFDAFAIGLPTIIYANDIDRYQKSRGVYEDIWNDLKPLIVNNFDDVSKRITTSRKVSSTVSKLMGKYSYESETPLIDFLESLNVDTLERDW